MRRLFVVASLALLIPAGMAQSPARHKPQPLNDAAMDRVTAGGMTAGLSDGVVKFQGSVPTKNGLVTGAGTMAVLTGPLTTIQNQGTLTLSGGAQQNLTSLVNINAVNSNVNVLLNLNVNINSTVGTITQTNLTGKH
ncbi:MAG: hypothetical protein JWQ49_4517 [Edaphobacter sp.]|nr:hypothetical protein [Edaphobacter sp.]